MNTMRECETVIHDYLAWLKAGLSATEAGDGVCEITTPFLDRNNDHLQIYLNGRKVADIRDDSFPRGKFGLQVHAGEAFARMAIRIADMRVRRLD